MSFSSDWSLFPITLYVGLLKLINRVFQANDIGSVFAVSFSEHNSIFVYHADDYQLFRTITNDVTGSEHLDLTHGALSNDGGYLLTSIERFPKGHEKKEEDDDSGGELTYMVSIDLKNGKINTFKESEYILNLS